MNTKETKRYRKCTTHQFLQIIWDRNFSNQFLEKGREVCLIEYGLWSEENSKLQTEDSRSIRTIMRKKLTSFFIIIIIHHHIHESLGVFPVPWYSRWIWSLHLFLGRPMFFRPFGLYCSACFGSLFMFILCTCCSHFSWYYFISFTMFLLV